MTDSYIDLVNRREVYIQRLASYLRNEYTNTNLDEAYRIARLILLDSGDITSIKKRNAVMEAIKEAVKPVTAEMWKEVTGELTDFAAQDASHYASIYATTAAVNLSVPASEKIEGYINKALLSLDTAQGKQEGKWAQFVTANNNSVYTKINDQIKSGYRNSETVDQMVKRVKNVTDGMLKNQAEALVRTGAAHYSASARRAMVEDNIELFDREIPSTVFDNRTTDICISISERYREGWPVGESPIGYNPYHFGCRTIIVQLVKGQKEIDGTKAYVGGKKGKAAEESFENRNKRLENKRNNPEHTGEVASQVRRKGNKDKAFSAGQIKASTPFATWLKSQPDWFITDTLGAKRAQLFKAGELDLANLTDKNLKPLTLKQIEGK